MNVNMNNKSYETTFKAVAQRICSRQNISEQQNVNAL